MKQTTLTITILHGQIAYHQLLHLIPVEFPSVTGVLSLTLMLWFSGHVLVIGTSYPSVFG